VSRLLAATVLVIATAAAAGCGGNDAGGAGGKATVLQPGTPIGMKSLKFRPDHVQATVGQEVTWRNDESIPHDVKANDGADFSSKTFGKNGTFAWTPTKAGTVKYECTLHPGMEGTIDVVAQ
jgi:plastocyanin